MVLVCCAKQLRTLSCHVCWYCNGADDSVIYQRFSENIHHEQKCHTLVSPSETSTTWEEGGKQQNAKQKKFIWRTTEYDKQDENNNSPSFILQRSRKRIFQRLMHQKITKKAPRSIDYYMRVARKLLGTSVHDKIKNISLNFTLEGSWKNTSWTTTG